MAATTRTMAALRSARWAAPAARSMSSSASTSLVRTRPALPVFSSSCLTWCHCCCCCCCCCCYYYYCCCCCGEYSFLNVYGFLLLGIVMTALSHDPIPLARRWSTAWTARAWPPSCSTAPASSTRSPRPWATSSAPWSSACASPTWACAP